LTGRTDCRTFAGIVRGWRPVLTVAVVLLGAAPAVARPLELRAGDLRARIEEPWRLVFEDSEGKTVLDGRSLGRLAARGKQSSGDEDDRARPRALRAPVVW
jgi:hypothetical protein